MAKGATPLERLTWEELDLLDVACSKDLDPEVSIVLIEFQRLVGEGDPPDPNLCREPWRCSVPSLAVG